MSKFILNINDYRFINLSEEKTSIEKELKSKLNATNNTIYILTNELENLQKEIEEKNINNNKLFEDCQNLSYLLETKNNTIKQLKSAKKQLEKKNLELEYQLEQNTKELEYIKTQNLFQGLSPDNRETINEKNEYYEKQLNDSNKTIKKMGEMIHELEKQIEELQKELENNYIESKNNTNNSNNINNSSMKNLIDLIKKKDKEIKQYKVDIRILNEEKNKLYEDNTKMYTNLDRFQKYIMKLIEENKNLSKNINKYSNVNSQSQNKEIKTLNESEVNEDDISKNNYKEFNLDFLNKIEDKMKDNNTLEINTNIKYNELNENENEINDNEKDKKINKNREKKYFKINDSSNKENESLNSNNNKIDHIFGYDGKEIEELSD